jgi:hypothetical protein
MPGSNTWGGKLRSYQEVLPVPTREFTHVNGVVEVQEEYQTNDYTDTSIVQRVMLITLTIRIIYFKK